MADKNIFCIEHIEECIALYCTQCEDFICISCVAGIHNGHKMSKLSTLGNFLDKALTTDMKEDLENLHTRFNTLKAEVDEKISNQSDDIVNLQCRIKDNTILLQAKLTEHDADLLASLPERTHPIYNIKEKILFLENMISIDQENYQSASTCYGIKSEKLVQIKQYMAVKEFKKMSQTVRKVSSSIDLKYQPSQIVTGKLTNSESLDTPENNGTAIKVANIKQYLSSNVEQHPECENFDFSSDEVRNELPKILYLSGLDKKVKKILPVSDEKAWMQLENILFMVSEKETLALKCEDNVDDFSMFGDRSLLILNKSNVYIKRRLHSGKLINFSSVQPYNPLWLDINSQNQVVMLVTESLSTNEKPRNVYHLVLFCDKGIKQQEIKNISLPTYGTSGIKLTISDSLFFASTNKITCRNLKNMKDQTFAGVFGVNPSINFKTAAVALGPDESVIVLDMKHPAILLLDKNLEYKKIILDATNNLEEPSCVAFYNNRLWVIDGNRILIWNYYP